MKITFDPRAAADPDDIFAWIAKDKAALAVASGRTMSRSPNERSEIREDRVLHQGIPGCRCAHPGYD